LKKKNIIYFLLQRGLKLRKNLIFKDKQNRQNGIMIMDGVINNTLEVKHTFFPCHMSKFQFTKN